MVCLKKIQEASEKYKKEMRKKYGSQWYNFCPECGTELKVYDYMDFKGNIGYHKECKKCRYKKDEKFEPIPKY